MLSLLSNLGIRKDSIIGVYLSNSNPLPVIGRGSVNNGGACIYNGNNSTMSITCTNKFQRFIQVESDISKYYILHVVTSTFINF